MPGYEGDPTAQGFFQAGQWRTCADGRGRGLACLDVSRYKGDGGISRRANSPGAVIDFPMKSHEGRMVAVAADELWQAAPGLHLCVVVVEERGLDRGLTGA